MKLIISVIDNEDAKTLTATLLKKGYQATIMGLSDILEQGKTITLAIPTEDKLINDAISIIKDVCSTRSRHTNPLPLVLEPGELAVPLPVTVEEGGAKIFVLDMEQFYQF